MPVAFHPPLEHPIDPAPAVHTSDDGADAGLFAAMLATAGNSPVDAAAAIRAQEAAAHAAAGRDSGSGVDEPRSDRDKTRSDSAGAPGGFDALSAFAPWLSAPLAAALAQGAARASEPAAASDAGGAVAGADVRSIAAARSASARDLGTTTDTSATTVPPDGRSDGEITSGHAFRRSPAHPSPPLVRTNGNDASVAAQGADDARGKSPSTASAMLATPFAAVAEQLAKVAAAKLLGGADPSSPAHAHDIDSAPGVNLATGATAPVATIAVREVNGAVGAPGFGTEVAGEIAQLINLKSDRAQLHVHPADMGPIDVAMRIEHNRVSVVMVAGDPQTRQALEQAIPQLRDLLADQGLALADASVRDHSQRDGQGDGNHANGSARGGASPGIAASLAPTPMVANLAVRRLVDLYA